ncbi:hypothetical protein [Enterobacter mori]|nr:hypothetical protein [Enterobacter mori]
MNKMAALKDMMAIGSPEGRARIAAPTAELRQDIRHSNGEKRGTSR